MAEPKEDTFEARLRQNITLGQMIILSYEIDADLMQRQAADLQARLDVMPIIEAQRYMAEGKGLQATQRVMAAAVEFIRVCAAARNSNEGASVE